MSQRRLQIPTHDIDSWLVITITKVIPDFFETIKSKDDRSAYYASMMSAALPPEHLGDISASGNSDSNEVLDIWPITCYDSHIT